MKVFFYVLICAIFVVNGQFTPMPSQDNFYNKYYEQFIEFKNLFNKVYDSSDIERMRRKIFAENKYLIDEHNRRYQIGEEKYEKMVDMYTDMLPHERSLPEEPLSKSNLRYDNKNRMKVDDSDSEDLDVIVKSFDFDYNSE